MNIEKMTGCIRMIRSRSSQQFRIKALGVCASVAIAFSGMATAAVPALDTTYLGGTPTGVNNSGQVIGYTLDANGVKQGWVYTPGQGTTLLPAPDGWNTTPAAISDTGIVVGSVDDGISRNSADGASVWKHNGLNYDITVLDLLDTTGSSALDVNSQGDIVGSRTYWTLWPNGSTVEVTRGYVYTKDGVLLEDPLTYVNDQNNSVSAIPRAINDNRQIVGDALRMDLNTGLVENLYLSETTNQTFINGINAYAINESGQVAARGWNSQGSFAMYYTGGVGWTALTIPVNSAMITMAYDINDSGDVLMQVPGACSGAAGTVAYFAAENTSACLQQLLSDQNWQIISNGAAGINNVRGSAVVAENVAMAQSGAVALSASGALPPPTAPSNLVATPHEATYQQPFIAIDLVWADNSADENAFRIDRSATGAGLWVEIGRVNANVWGFRDNNVEALAAYDYRVVAEGLSGESYSEVVSVTAPAAVDTVAPTVAIESPTEASTISGNFDVIATVADNVGISTVVMEMLINGTATTICTLTDPLTSSVSCSVNAKKNKFADGALLTLGVTAYDAMQNSMTTSVNVTWSKAASTGGGDTGGSGKGNGKGKK